MATEGTLRRAPTANGSKPPDRAAIRSTPGSAARISARNRSRILLGCLVALVSALAMADFVDVKTRPYHWFSHDTGDVFALARRGPR